MLYPSPPTCTYQHSLLYLYLSCSKRLICLESLENNLQMYIKELKSRKMNLPAWLLVLFVIAAAMCYGLKLNIISSLVTNPSSCFEAINDVHTPTQNIFFAVEFTILGLFFPLIGWLTDTIIGRERAINLSLWSCWCGILLQCISYSIQYGTCGLPVNIAKYGISGVALLLLMLGIAGIFTNIPAYGLDQLSDKPNTNARAFIHWIVWGFFFGVAIGIGTGGSNDSEFLLITGIMIFLFISVALCLHACFYNYYKLVGTQKNNPYKIVYNVLKYALYHKSPENRSAFTYWENEIPSRVDLGKSKYGGPFSEEDVENVKTFWRIVAVILSTFGLFIPYYHVITDGVVRYINTFEGATTALNGHGSSALWLGLESQIILLVPLFELVIIPLYPKIEYFILKALRAIGVSYILLLIALLFMIVLELVGHFVTPKVVCATSLSSTGDDLVQISFLYYIIPLVFSGLAHALFKLYILEFIISQAPANMSGMIVGTLWFIHALYVTIGHMFIFWNISGHVSCSFWVLLIQIGICIIGMIIYMLVARWYRRRRKNEDYEVHAVVNATYDHILENRQEQYSECRYKVLSVL